MILILLFLPKEIHIPGSTRAKELIIFYVRELELFSVGNKNINDVIDGN